jgi:flagellar biosynthesis/type III secretory pathway chaperone
MTREIPSEDKSPHPLTSINSILRAQLDALTHIEEILSAERAALRTRNAEELLITADAKAQALARLSELESQRKLMSADLDTAHIEDLREIAARCRGINQENAALLNAQQHHVDRLLGLLRGNRDNRPTSYDASGKTTGIAAKQLRLTEA